MSPPVWDQGCPARELTQEVLWTHSRPAPTTARTDLARPDCRSQSGADQESECVSRTEGGRGLPWLRWRSLRGEAWRGNMRTDCGSIWSTGTPGSFATMFPRWRLRSTARFSRWSQGKVATDGLQADGCCRQAYLPWGLMPASELLTTGTIRCRINATAWAVKKH